MVAVIGAGMRLDDGIDSSGQNAKTVCLALGAAAHDPAFQLHASWLLSFFAVFVFFLWLLHSVLFNVLIDIQPRHLSRGIVVTSAATTCDARTTAAFMARPA